MLRRVFVRFAAIAGMSLAAPARGFAQMDSDTATPTARGEGATTMTDTATPSAKTRDLVITRVFDAPVERVWEAWIDPEHVKRWWGPKGFTAPVADMDVREGGTSLVCMRSPEGQDFYNTWTYRKIVPLQLIEFIQNFADEDGNKIAPADAGLPPEIPEEVRHVITFKALAGNQTEMSVTEYGYTVDWVFDLSSAGMNECLDKMATVFTTA
jgi:uncharacterized protein YndB with AHSA1/START domain